MVRFPLHPEAVQERGGPAHDPQGLEQAPPDDPRTKALRQQLKERYGFDNIIGKSKPMQEVFELIQLAAPAKSNILMLGESGTGKELVAKAIHHHSRRADGPFVTVNSGSMPADLLESNLFGHVKGAFTGAVSNKKGLFEVATGRLDLLRRDRQHTARHSGQAVCGSSRRRSSCVSAAIETLRADVRHGGRDQRRSRGSGGRRAEFREDLYYRLNVIKVSVAPAA